MRPFRPLLLVAAALAWGITPLAYREQGAQPDEPPRPPEGLALATAETLEFTTDEVTWPSVDVAPDGRTLVFDVLGDIYTLPVEGGTATRIIGGLSFESQPRFSPDGRTLAFLSDRSGVENLWIADTDGGNARAVSKDGLTRDRPQIMVSPSWTPDGQYIVVSKSRPPDPGTFWLFMYHRDGGQGVRVGAAPPSPPGPDAQGPPPPPPANRMGAVVTPDGRFIYYAQRTGTFTYNARFPLWQIHRHDRETGEAAQVTNAQGSAMRPVIAPDGRWLVYGTRYKTDTGLRVRNLETGAERWLVLPVTRDDQESRASRDTLPGYAFMPDGQSLIIPIGGKFHRVDFATGATRIIPMTVPVKAEIAPRVYTPVRVDDGPTVRARLVRWPTLSPDGSQVAFSAMNRVYVADVPGGPPRLLTTVGTDPQRAAASTPAPPEGEFMPSWSPDGRSIVYATWTTRGGHIKRVAATGGAPETLTRFEGYYLDPAYTPDGSKVVYLSGAVSDQLYSILLDTPPGDDPERVLHAPGEIGGISPANTLEIRWMPAAGGASTFVAAAQNGRRPHFAGKDSSRVYLSSSRGLQSIDISGYDRRTHLRVTGSGAGNNPPAAEEIRLSPDGARAFVSLQGRHYVMPVPRAGRETVEVRVQGRGENASVPLTRLSTEGGDYVAWSADGATVTWAMGALFFSQAADGTGEPRRMEFIVERPRARPRGSVLLTGARIITMKGDEVIPRGDVLITDSRIAGVGRRGALRPPAGARTIDVSGRTIMPGLVDAHAHMWAPRGLHQTEVWQYMANLAYGVTTTRDPQTSTPDVFAYADLVDAGVIAGPRIYATGPGIFGSSGIEDRDRAFQFMKRYRDAYRTNTIKQYVAGDRLVRQWLVEAAKEYGITATIEGSLDLKLNLTQMADGYSGQEHSLPIMPLYRDVVEFVARTKTFYTPTILVAYGAPWSENFYFESESTNGDAKLKRWIPEELLDTMIRRRPQWFLPEEYGHAKIGKQVADIVHAGGRAALGSHGQLQGLGAHWETWNLGAGGLTPHETLRVVTLYGAEAIGMQQDVGSLEPGKLADLIVLDRNPLENIRHTNSIRYVMKNGELYEGDTLNMIWPEARPMPKPFWEGFGPAPGRAGAR
ncbi:MAG: PD40 domain-containing protein [Acidobacteria bacterium]|nr:PD40 domain-containing protein [Acidobacteriota bacterium]